MFQKSLIKHCSPTLAGIKTGSLFTFCNDNLFGIESLITDYNSWLNEKGVYIEIMRKRKNTVLLYVYRPRDLKRDFANVKTSAFLKELGYKPDNLKQCIDHLKFRISECEGFPHEVGLFLSYPIDDVIGFIEHNGDDFLLSGYWKVYCNKNYAQQCFYKFKRCSEDYVQLFNDGNPLNKLVV